MPRKVHRSIASNPSNLIAKSTPLCGICSSYYMPLIAGNDAQVTCKKCLSIMEKEKK
jgi:hypothetical protein